MAETLGDLKISVILDIAQTQKEAAKVTTTLKNVEAQARNTEKTFKEVSKTSNEVGMSAKDLRGNITGLGYGFIDLTHNLSRSDSILSGLIGTMGAAIGTGSALAGSIVGLAGALALLTKYTGFDFNPTAGVQTGLIKWFMDMRMDKILQQNNKVLYPDEKVNPPIGDINIPKADPKDLVNVPKVSRSGLGSGPAMVKAEKEIKKLSDNFAGFILFDAARNVNKLIAHGKISDILPGTVPGQTDLEKLAEKTRYQPRAIDQTEEPGVNLKDAVTSSLDLANEFSSILGLSADHFVNKFLGGLNQGISLINSLSNFVSVFAGGGGIFSGLFSMLGFSSGPGAYGGAMSTGVINNLNYSRAREVPYILSTEVSGTSLKTVLRRVDYLDRRSTY